MENQQQSEKTCETNLLTDDSEDKPENHSDKETCGIDNLSKAPPKFQNKILQFYNEHSGLRFAFFALGIIVLWTLYSIAIGDITKKKYGNDTKFNYVTEVTAILFSFYYLFARIYLWIRPPPTEDKTQFGFYMLCGLINTLATITGLEGLLVLPYAVQVVGKSAKPVPVIILGKLVGKKSYTIQKYIFVFIIVVGVSLAVFDFEKKSSKKNDDNGLNYVKGAVLIVFSLAMDGLLGAVEERVRATYKPTGMQMMQSITGWCFIYSVLAVLLRNNALEFFKFVYDFPKILVPLTLLPVYGIFGQIFIYAMLEDFGALPVSIVTTIRKAVTFVLVVILFPEGERQFVVWNWLGAVLMFGSIFVDTIYHSDKMRNGIKNQIVSVMSRKKSDHELKCVTDA